MHAALCLGDPSACLLIVHATWRARLDPTRCRSPRHPPVSKIALGRTFSRWTQPPLLSRSVRVPPVLPRVRAEIEGPTPYIQRKQISGHAQLAGRLSLLPYMRLPPPWVLICYYCAVLVRARTCPMTWHGSRRRRLARHRHGKPGPECARVGTAVAHHPLSSWPAVLQPGRLQAIIWPYMARGCHAYRPSDSYPMRLCEHRTLIPGQ